MLLICAVKKKIDQLHDVLKKKNNFSHLFADTLIINQRNAHMIFMQ